MLTELLDVAVEAHARKSKRRVRGFPETSIAGDGFSYARRIFTTLRPANPTYSVGSAGADIQSQ